MPKCSCKTRYIPAVFAWTLFLVTTGLFFYYPCRYFIHHFPWIPIVEGVIAFFVFANFSLATFMDPGIIPKAPPDEDRGDDFRAPLYKNVDISGITVRMKWCVTCKFYRPPRCSHCSVCNHCIETFDHHCPWMNNCIGRRNYRFFFFFLISLSLHMICVFSACAFFVIKHKQREKDPGILVSLIMMVLIAILVIPIFGLTGFHMVLVSRGRTTNEQVTGKFKGGYNPFSRGCYRNCCYIQCGPLYPSIQNAKRFMHKRRESVATVVSDNQVKTYTDTSNNNSIRNIVGSHSYNKLSPKREVAPIVYEIDLEQTISSQSIDCEPTPPPSLNVQRQGSKKQNNQNLSTHGHETLKESIEQTFDRFNAAATLRGSPHPKHRNMTVDQKSRTYLSNSHETSSKIANTTNDMSRAPLTMHQRIKAVGIPTPILMSSSNAARRSNPGTPTQPKRPDFINVSSSSNKSTIYDFPLKSAAGSSYYYPHQMNQQQQQQQHYHHHNHRDHHDHDHHQQHYQQQSHEQPHTYHPNPSALYGTNFLTDNSQRRYVSGVDNDAQSRATKENIRELVGSPQKSIYTWKDNPSLSYRGGNYADYQHSNVASPTTLTTGGDQAYLSQSATKKSNLVKVYHPSIHGGVAVYPQSSPQMIRKPVILQSQTLPDNRRRPMSFARALEMSDSIEMTPTLGNAPSTNAPVTTSSNHASQNETLLSASDRASVYDTNYEISV